MSGDVEVAQVAVPSTSDALQWRDKKAAEVVNRLARLKYTS